MRFAIAALLLAIAAAATAGEVGEHRLTWAAVVQTEHGIALIQTPHKSPFPDKAACEAFGDARAARHGDWIRGFLQVSLEFPITVGFACEPAGDPA